MRDSTEKSSQGNISLDAVASGNSALAQLGQGHQHNYFGASVPIPPVSDWIRVADVDPIILGIHKCRPIGKTIGLTPYVARDVDSQISESISQSRSGGFTLIVGDSTAGKTRSLYEAILESLPDARIISPSNPGSIRQIPQLAHESEQQSVLWLDDLERFLGPDGVEPFLVGQLINAGVCIAATLRAERYEAFMPRAERAAGMMRDETAQHIARIGMQVLNIADTIEMDRVWSPSEIRSAQEFADQRIIEAIDHHGPYGIAEYLAAGPPLYGEWKRALRAHGNPRGHALVAAAVDLARAGLIHPIKLSDLEALHHLYLDKAGGPLLRPESFEEAVDWATSIRYGVTSLLMPSKDNRWRAFDYLIDSASRDQKGFPAEDSFWLTAASLAAVDWEYFNITQAASKNGRRELTERLWIERAHGGDSHAAFHLALHYAELEEAATQEHWVRRAAEEGNPQALLMLGELQIDRGDLGDATISLSKGLELGEEDCAWKLGTIHIMLGDMVKAEEFWRTGHAMGSVGAGTSLGIHLDHQGQLESAIEVFRRTAIESSMPNTQYNLARALERHGSIDESKTWYEKAADAGHAHAQTNLGVLLTKEGDLQKALEYFLKATDGDDGLGACHAADIEGLMGREEEAERLYEKSFTLGLVHAADHLGILHIRRGDLSLAKHWFRISRAHGNESATWNLGMIRLYGGDIPSLDVLIICNWPN
ncbi:hypothetical protein GCM10018781_25550 [Kitasatospora indigofera]|uniref:Sel1 repeat family protein n=1 Tax=Kitasatospora indigofera TaxID=67307 RepID=A0A919KQH1_9ACTN|nr:tetratricopeptide repeat protein [Kitasatospora indigofera]GHH68478.1 hypothetical protein GCM10018781_25550 [Kitasatospora indigofera]